MSKSKAIELGDRVFGVEKDLLTEYDCNIVETTVTAISHGLPGYPQVAPYHTPAGDFAAADLYATHEAASKAVERGLRNLNENAKKYDARKARKSKGN